jgi:hypothetical protein
VRSHAPAVAVLRPEQCDLAHYVGRRYARRELAMHGLGYNEVEVVCESVCKPLLAVRGGISMTEGVVRLLNEGQMGAPSIRCRVKWQARFRTPRARC